VLLGVTLIALAARVLTIVLTPHFALVNDAADYHRLAVSLAAGHGFGTTHVAPGGGPTALRPPAFPLLLAAVYYVFGAGVAVARIVGAVLGTISAVLVTVLIGQLGGDRRSALIGGLLAALLPSMVIASTSVMSEGLFVPLSLGVISSALAYRARGRSGWLALVGLLLAAATLTRPIGAVLALPAALLAFTGRPAARRRLRAAVLGALLAIAPCAAWEIRDVTVLHRVIPLTTQDGYLLAGTYNATSAHFPGQPGVWVVPTYDPALARLVAAHPGAQEAQLNDILHRAAIDYATGHPGYVATVVAYNFLRLFDLTSPSFVRAAVSGEYGYGSRAGTADYVCTLALIALAVVGIFRRGPRTWPAGVWLVPLLLLAVTLPTHANPRFRAPLDPVLVVFASATVARVSAGRRYAGRLRIRQRRTAQSEPVTSR
jgi:4-amino-4-deoxy-L-arabinose transferase-like glycosyltransferase